MSIEGFVGKDIVLSVGLPPAHHSKYKEKFTKYFEHNTKNGVEFTYLGKKFNFHVAKVLCLPQDWSACLAYEDKLLAKSRKAYCIDIGAGTVDMIELNNGQPNPACIISKQMGITRMMEQIKNHIINQEEYEIVSEDIEEVLMDRKNSFVDDEIKDIIYEEAKNWANEIVNELHLTVLNFRTSPTIFCGGGSIILKDFLKNREDFKEPVFIEDIRANAIGYEVVAKNMLKAGN